MKKANKKLASAIVLGLMLAVPVGASAENPYNVETGDNFVNFVGKEAAGNNTFTITEADLAGYDGKTIGVYGYKNMVQGTEVNITGNKITVSGIDDSVLKSVTGAYTAKGVAENNSITLTDSVLAVGNSGYAESYGAQSGAGDVTGNEFILTNVTVKDGEDIGEARLAGGLTYNGNADSNKLVLDNVQAKATFTSGNFIAGGYANNGTVDANELQVKNSEIVGQIHGGLIGVGNADGTSTINENNVVVESSEVNGVYGARYLDSTNAGEASGNIVTVNNSTLELVTGAYIAKGAAKDNSVTVTDSTLLVNGSGYAENYGAQSGEGDVTGNEFILTNVTVKDGGGIGEARLAGGLTYNGNADGNKLVLDNVQANATFDSGNFIAGGFAINGTANGNEVVITGDSKITGIVYGGYSTSGAATGNTIIIDGNADVSNADLHGGNNNDAQRAADKDNKLIIGDNWSGAIGSVADFEDVTLGAGSSVETAINDEATTVNMTAGSTWNVNENSTVNTITGTGTIGLEVTETTAETESLTRDLGAASGYTATTTVTVNNVDSNANLTLTASNLDAGDVANLDEATAIFGALKTGMNSGDTTGVTGMEIKETITNAAITADKNGEDVQQAQYSTTEANIRDIASVALVAWRQEDSTLSQRLGELRNSEGDQGIWARMSRGEFEYGGAFKNQYNYFQLGYDKAYGDWHYGAAISHNDGQTTYASGYGENDSTSLTLYGTWLGDKGQYTDIVVKQGKLNNEFTNYADAGTTTGDYDMWGTSISAEYGQKLEMKNDWYVTPQAQLTYMRIGGEDYTANVATKGNDGKVTNAPMYVSQDGMDSFVGRIGFEAGKNISEKGSIYAKASLLHEFAGEADTTFLYGNNPGGFSQDLGDTWYECGFGVNYKTSDNSYVYADVVKTFGGDVETPWQWNAGMRFTF